MCSFRIAVVKRCPILSNDSDFFVYPVEFIKLDSIGHRKSNCTGTFKISLFKLNTIPAHARYLSCQRFDRSAFTERFGISSQDMLYLMASVLGNDYVPTKTMEKFFAQVKMPKKRKGQNCRHAKMTGVLGWLSRETSVEEAMDKMLAPMPLAERERVREKVLRSISVYKEDMAAEEVSPSSTSTQCEEAKTFGEKEIPSWFLEEFRRAKYPAWLMDALCNREIVLASQVENKRYLSHTHTLFNF